MGLGAGDPRPVTIALQLSSSGTWGSQIDFSEPICSLVEGDHHANPHGEPGQGATYGGASMVSSTR